MYHHYVLSRMLLACCNSDETVHYKSDEMVNFFTLVSIHADG